MAEAIGPTSATPVNHKLGTAQAPPDNLGGSTVQVGGNPADLRAAMGHPTFKTGLTPALKADGSHNGHTYMIPRGPVYLPINFPVSGAGWTRLRPKDGSLPSGTPGSESNRVGAAHVAQTFNVQSLGLQLENQEETGSGGTGLSEGSSRAMRFAVGSQGWHVIGAHATHPNTVKQYGLVDLDGSRIIIDRSYLHGDPLATFMARVFMWRGTDCQLWDSSATEAQALGQDAQAAFFRGSIRSHLENNRLEGSGENVMLGDQGSSTPALDTVLLRNLFSKPSRWRHFLPNGQVNPDWDGHNWVIKNLFEIKWARRTLLEGNRLEHNWSGQGQDGTAIVLYSGGLTQSAVMDTMIRSNILDDIAKGFTLAFGDGSGGESSVRERTAILNNLLLRLYGRMVLFNWRGVDDWLEGNTGVPMDLTSGAAVEFQVAQPGFIRNTIRKNIVGYTGFGLRREGGALTTAYADANIPDRDWQDNAVYGAIGQACAGFDFYPSAAALGLDLDSGVLDPSSPAVGRGVDFAALEDAQPGDEPDQEPIVIATLNLTINLENQVHETDYTGMRVRFQRSPDGGVNWADVQSNIRPLGTTEDSYDVLEGELGQYRAGAALTDGEVFGPEVFSGIVTVPVGEDTDPPDALLNLRVVSAVFTP